MTQVRRNIFVIHSWDDSALYYRLNELLSSNEAGLADYSVPPSKALEGNESEIAAGIRQRISTASAVIVLNTPGLHKRPWSSFEMEIATSMGKRIVVLQPPGQYDQPIPSAIHDGFYRVVPWRSDVVGRAIRGEYPQDMRIFDISEVADRRKIIAAVSAGVGVVSLAWFAHSTMCLRDLMEDFRQSGMEIGWGDSFLSVIGWTAAIGLTSGLITTLITDDPKSGALAGGAGALVGMAIGARRVYKATLQKQGHIQVLTVEHSL